MAHQPRHDRSRSPVAAQAKQLSLPGEPFRFVPSEQAKSMLLDWGSGKLSVPHMRRHCSATHTDSINNNSACPPDVVVLGGLGGNNPSTQNSQRQLLTLLNSLEFAKLIEPVVGQNVKFCVPPGGLIRFLLKRYTTATRRCLGFRAASVEKFWIGVWESEDGARLFAEHPSLRGKTPPDLKRSVPLCLHEDAGPFSKKKSMHVLSCSGLLGVGTEKETKLLFSSHVSKKGEKSVLPGDPAYKLFVSSCLAMSLGTTETGEQLFEDEDGAWSAIMLFGKADFEALTQCWGMTSYNGASEVCGWCRADRTARPYTDLQEDAQWRPTEILDIIAFKARFGIPHHPWIDVFFFTTFFIRIDCMHDLDHNGVSGCAIGSLLMGLVKHEARLGSNQAARLRSLNSSLDEFQKSNKVTSRFPEIGLNTLSASGGEGDFACLAGPGVKAANTRCIVPWAANLSQTYCDTDTQKDKSIRKMFSSLCTVYDTLYSSDMFMTSTQRDTLKLATLRFGRHYQWLNIKSTGDGICMYNVKPKHHFMQHIPRQSRLLNPRFTQCYMEEGFIGDVSDMWKSSVNGPYEKTMQRTVLVRNLVSVQILYSGFKT